MNYQRGTNKFKQRLASTGTALGFTIPEVIIAGTIMIVLCVGTMSVFSYVVKINRGNHLRMQALAVLQREVEEFRSFKFVPVGSDIRLNGANYPNYKTGLSAPASSDGRKFNITVTIDNSPFGDGVLNNPEASCTFKQITIRAVPQVAENEVWLQNLHTEVTILRVRSN